MDKPIVFISHITQEVSLAELLKERISQDFLGMIDVFVSSDDNSILLGSKWLDNIGTALQTAKVEIVICSHDSIMKPWINFEAGAGWVKGIPIVPICHSGLRPVELPIPLNMLQGITANDQSGLKKLYSLLAAQLGASVPSQSFDEFIEAVKKFEQQYGVVRKIKHNVKALIQLIPELKPIFQPNPENTKASGNVNLLVVDKMKPHLQSLKEAGFIEYAISQSQNIMISPEGQSTDVKIQVLGSYYEYSEQIFRDIG